MPGVTVDEIFQPRNKFDLLLEGLIYALLIFAPLAMGVVEAWSEFVVVCLGAAIALVLSSKFLFDRDARQVWSWAYAPLTLFILFGVVQIIPLPSALVSLISPNTVELKRELIGDIASLERTTISFYPAATMHNLRLVLVFAALFAASAHVFRSQPAVRRLLTVIATLGATLALLTITQVLTGTTEIYWLIEKSTDSIANGGPFVNRNNFCVFMNLAVGCSLALLLLKINDGLEGMPKSLANVLDWITSPNARWVWLLIGTLVLSMTATFLSLSRGGVVALLFAGASLTLLMALRQRLEAPAWVMVCLALAAFVGVLLLGFDAVYDRLSTLQGEDAYHGRWEIAKGVVVAWTQFPLLGAGLGTHEVVYPMFGRLKSPSLFAHAENEYAQLAEEMGVIGLLALISFLFFVFRAWLRCLGGGWATALAYGLGFALATTLVHSVGDFGFHLPANHGLVAVLCGTLIGVGQCFDSTASTHVSLASRRLIAPAVSAVFVGALGWAVLTGNDARAAEAHWTSALASEARMENRDWQATDEQYADLIRAAARAHDRVPSNVHFRYWLAVYRWRAISRDLEERAGAIVLTEETEALVERIVRDLHEARETCPTFGPAYCVAGQLERLYLHREIGEERIRTAFKLAPFDPMVCFAVGALETTAGRHDVALTCYRRALDLDERLFGDIASVLLRAGRLDLAVQLAGDEVRRLELLEKRLADREVAPGSVAEVQQRMFEVLRGICESPDAPPHALARVAAHYDRNGDYLTAEELYRRALTGRYDQVAWRLSLARVYVRLDRMKDATRHARICLRLRPGLDAARNLLEQLTRSVRN